MNSKKISKKKNKTTVKNYHLSVEEKLKVLEVREESLSFAYRPCTDTSLVNLNMFLKKCIFHCRADRRILVWKSG
jgi:hypothetical protein